jgi:hypothetical protein
VYAGALNNSWQTPEENRVVRHVTEVFLHAEFNTDTYINDIAILKVMIIFKWDIQMFYIFMHNEIVTGNN